MTTTQVETPTAKLNTGSEIPLLGFGTYQVDQSAIEYALKDGYKHFDTADIYGTEEALGKAIKASGVDRKTLFITTKLWPDRQGNVRETLDKSLERLGLEYVDLYLIHLPHTFDSNDKSRMKPLPYAPDQTPSFHTAWKEMSEIFREDKKVKAIGVSNFSEKILEELFAKGGPDVVIPAVNQIELSPDLPQHELVAYCTKKGIHCTAWGPLGGQNENNRSSILVSPLVEEMAKAHDCTTGQILIAWGIQRGTSTLPKSSTPKRIATNGKLVKLTDDEMSALNEKLSKADYSSNPKLDSKRFRNGDVANDEGKIWGWTFEEMGW